MRRWHYLAVGAAVYLVSLLVMFPATQALSLLHPYLAGEGITLAARDVDGTLWHGRAGSASVNGASLGESEWRLSSLLLLIGRVSLDWSARPGGGQIQGAAVADGERLKLHDVRGTIPADYVRALIPYLPVPVGGELLPNLEQVVLTDNRALVASGNVVWRDATVTAGEPLPLGDLTLTLEPLEGGGVSGTVDDGGGPLDAAGRLRLEPDGRYSIELSLAARPGATQMLDQSLRLLGRPDAEGRVRLAVNGRL